uniref:Glycoside hydrolase family 38 central domain-containing protein n=1 Tax=Parascaris equorum TaxID=6256 RepID=A0A914RQK5_PAREQ
MCYFVTQKMSWSLINQFPHHSFRWMGIDGTRVLTHFPPHHYVSQLEKNANNLCEWRGELYLELHNASYTTQSAIKKMNRLIEGLLRDHEFLQAMERIEVGGGRSLSDEWKMLLLNQFHDVLPGTSIKEVVEDAMDIYRRLVDILTVDNGNGLKMIILITTGTEIELIS